MFRQGSRCSDELLLQMQNEWVRKCISYCGVLVRMLEACIMASRKLVASWLPVSNQSLFGYQMCACVRHHPRQSLCLLLRVMGRCRSYCFRTDVAYTAADRCQLFSWCSCPTAGCGVQRQTCFLRVTAPMCSHSG
jgi:hypothetical protein